jgi:hypothetical protein
MREKIKSSDQDIVTGNPAESGNVRNFIDGSFRSAISLRSASIGLGTYQPGWQWKLHAGAQTGKSSENHVGYIISGRMAVEGSNGTVIEVGPGEAFEAGPGHDARVIGGVACIALDFNPAGHG